MSQDLRQYARQTNKRLLVGFILILFLVGDGLIYIFYGRSAAMLGLACMLAGMAPVLLVLLAFWIIDTILRANRMG